MKPSDSFISVRNKPSRSLENHWHVIGRVTVPVSPSIMCIGIDSLRGWMGVINGQEITGQDRTGQDRTGQDRTGQDRTGQDRTGEGKDLDKDVQQ